MEYHLRLEVVRNNSQLEFIKLIQNLVCITVQSFAIIRNIICLVLSLD